MNSRAQNLDDLESGKPMSMIALTRVSRSFGLPLGFWDVAYPPFCMPTNMDGSPPLRVQLLHIDRRLPGIRKATPPPGEVWLFA
jgi:hypothetical protein